MKYSILAAALLAAALLVGSPAMAQRTGPNGGMVAGASGHDVELVIAPTELTVFLVDHGRPAEMRGASARAVIQDGGRTITVQLVAGGNRLTGRLEAPLTKGARIVISGRMADGHTVQARFVAP